LDRWELGRGVRLQEPTANTPAREVAERRLSPRDGIRIKVAVVLMDEKTLDHFLSEVLQAVTALLVNHVVDEEPDVALVCLLRLRRLPGQSLEGEVLLERGL